MNKSEDEWNLIFDSYFKKIKYSGKIPTYFNGKRILYNRLITDEKIRKLGWSEKIPDDYSTKEMLKRSLEFGVDPGKFTDDQSVKESIIISNYKKNNQRSIISDYKKILDILNTNNFDILFQKGNILFCISKKSGKKLFLYVADGEPHEMEIGISLLSRFIKDLKTKEIKYFSTTNKIYEERKGALTDFDWHASYSQMPRIRALKRKIKVDGIEMTLNTLLHLSGVSRWGSPNSPNNIHLDAVLDDINWIKNHFPYEKSAKRFLLEEYSKIRSEINHQNIFPDMMLMVNINQ